MRSLFAVGIVAIAALVAAPAAAADYPEYPEFPTYELPELPQVDTGLTGGFYLRGSVGGNLWHASDATHCCMVTLNGPGYGYSLGVGFGYESGTGLRADMTFDYLSNDGLSATTGEKAYLRSGLVLANIYHDFMFHEGGAAGGGIGAYVGGGLGFAKNYSEIKNAAGTVTDWGTSVEAAAAAMIGVTYDMGSAVADFGWRGIYMNKVMNQPAPPTMPYIINNNFINELRASIRYRFY